MDETKKVENKLYCIVLHCVALRCVALHCIALHCTALLCTALHRIVLYRIVLYCRCALRFNKKHFMLMFSLFVMMTSSLLITLIPPVSVTASLEHCHGRGGTDLPPPWNVTSKVEHVAVVSSVNFTSGTVGFYSNDTGLTIVIKESTTPSRTTTDSTTTDSTTSMTTSTTTTTAETSSLAPVAVRPSHRLPIYSHSQHSGAFPGSTRKSSHRSHTKTTHGSALSTLTQSEFALLREYGITQDNLEKLNAEDLKSLVKALANTARTQGSHRHEAVSRRARRSVLESVNTGLSQFHIHLTELGINSPFFIVLALIIAAELLSVPIDRFTDKMWFDFLDGVDDLERYGQYGLWSLASFVVFPVVVTALVDHTPCVLPHGIHHFMIHFYMFAALIGVAFVCAHSYPIQTVSSLKSIFRKNRFVKGCRILFADVHCFTFAFSVFLSGALFAAVDNFLFWHVQDLGGAEVVMGSAVSLSAAAEYAMYMTMSWFLARLGHVAAVSLSFLVLSIRLLAYSFVWSPWMVMPLAPLQAFTHALLWGAVCSYPDFKLSPTIIDRSAHWVLSGCHYGVGVAAGSVLSGYLYDRFGIARVFQGAAAIAFLWVLIFSLVQRCVRKVEVVRYERLLQADDDKNEECLPWETDDWLESAMKDEV